MAVNLPVSYTEFLKNPIVGILFLSLFAISYLYIDNKATYKDVITKQETRIVKLEGNVENLQIQLAKRDSMIVVINNRLTNIK